MLLFETLPKEVLFSLYQQPRAYLRVIAEQSRQAHLYNEYVVDLTEYYNYCKLQDMEMHHTLDRQGSKDNQYKCGISFYFNSHADKAVFVLKFL